jgi:hypothetical protein
LNQFHPRHAFHASTPHIRVSVCSRIAIVVSFH